MGVQFAKPGKGDAIVGVARNPEREVEEAVEAVEAGGATPDASGPASGSPTVTMTSRVLGPPGRVSQSRRPMPYRRWTTRTTGGRE